MKTILRNCCEWFSVLLALALVSSASAGELSGFYKNLISATDVGDSYRNLGVIDRDVAFDDLQRVRLKLEMEPAERLSVRIHYEARTAWGDTVRIRRRLADAATSPSFLQTQGRRRFLDLESAPIEESNFRMTHELDRLQLRYQTDRLETTIGRQPVSWGSGLIWTPTDLFVGFSPTEIDRDEKMGVDVIRVLWSPGPDTSFDLVAEPLASSTYEMNRDDSSLALRATTHIAEYDVSLLGGAIAGDPVAGGDFTGYLANAGFRGEWIYTWVDDAGQRDYAKALASLDYAFARPWNPYLAVEYFYNGLGAGESRDYLVRLAESSVQRAFQRGTAFNLGQHYLGSTLRLTPNALVSLSATTLWNVEDGSAMEFATAAWSVTDNTELLVGATVGMGELGTEFGGFSAEQTGIPFENPDLYFTYLKYYF